MCICQPHLIIYNPMEGAELIGVNLIIFGYSIIQLSNEFGMLLKFVDGAILRENIFGEGT